MKYDWCYVTDTMTVIERIMNVKRVSIEMNMYNYEWIISMKVISMDESVHNMIEMSSVRVSILPRGGFKSLAGYDSEHGIVLSRKVLLKKCCHWMKVYTTI